VTGVRVICKSAQVCRERLSERAQVSAQLDDLFGAAASALPRAATGAMGVGGQLAMDN
jgi:hypothetical protein